MTSPTSVPLHLLALEQAAQPGALGDLAVGGDSTARVTSDAQLRAAIVNVAGYYQRLAKTRTPAQMEALIWDKVSSDGADHGPSCAAFASLTLELAAQAVGQQSWVTGGDTYPWPMPEWADVRVDTNPDSPAITSLVADAQTHERWHPLGDGYQPQPGDWAVYDEHVEVVTSYSHGVLDTIGADSLPDLSVNAHSSAAPLAEQGVTGFVDNGNLKPAGAVGSHGAADGHGPTVAPATSQHGGGKADSGKGGPRQGGAGKTATGKVSTGTASTAGGTHAGVAVSAAVPGVLAAGDLLGRVAVAGTAGSGHAGAAATAGTMATIPGLSHSAAGSAPTTGHEAAPGNGAIAIPGAAPAHTAATPSAQPAKPSGTQATHPATKPNTTHAAQPAAAHASASGQYATPGTRDQQAFISMVAPGAIAAQQRFGVPAAVTIAQAIEESAWGRSGLAAKYHNLFGIKGTGPAGSVSLPTSEFQRGQWVTIDAPFRVYHNDAESVADHAELLATSGYYTRAMADRGVPDAFANDLTGVYATDPDYGANLIALMKLYNLYQFDSTAPAHAAATTPTPAASPSVAGSSQPASHQAVPAHHAQASHPAVAPPPTGQSGHQRTGHAAVPGIAAPALAPIASAVTSAASARPGGAPAASGHIPGLVSPGRLAPAARPAGHGTAAAATTAPRRGTAQVPGIATANGIITTARVTRGTATGGPARYQPQLPHTVTTALFASAKAPLARGEHLYRDVAACTGIGWELLAAVDWMQCRADPRYSPVHGEKIGSLNDDGTSYPTKSAALIQCACDLIELAAAVYGIDLTARRRLSVRELASAFAAFRWGAILWRHGVSAMEFPYSVAGLTLQHQKMHWPSVDAPDAPDRPGARFREPFGAIPVVLSLDYPATV
jgi:flagellum-specific peptidoglycan hydrolase FlgJ